MQTQGHEFAVGIGLGMLAGTAMGMAMEPKNKSGVKKAADKAVKMVGQAMEDLTQELGH